MRDLSKYSLAQLRALEVQVIDELKTKHFLSISKAREQFFTSLGAPDCLKSSFALSKSLKRQNEG